MSPVYARISANATRDVEFVVVTAVVILPRNVF